MKIVYPVIHLKFLALDRFGGLIIKRLALFSVFNKKKL